MRKILVLFLLSISPFSYAQNDSLLAFLKASYEQEKSWQSGVIYIKNFTVIDDFLLLKGEDSLKFFHGPIESLFLLYDRGQGSYFSNQGSIEYAMHEYRRKYPDLRFPNAYPDRFFNATKQLDIGFKPEYIGEQPYKMVKFRIENEQDSGYDWNSEKRQLRFRNLVYRFEERAQYEVLNYYFDEQKRLVKASIQTLFQWGDTTFFYPSEGSRVRTFTYSRLNELPYIEIKQQLKTFQELPLQTVVRPERMEIKSSPKLGDVFPDLTLMDDKGQTKKLSAIYGPKIIIYYGVHLFDPDSLFQIIDSLEDQLTQGTIILANTLSIDELYLLKQKYPNLKSIHLVCEVDGLALNGWPVWMAVDSMNKLIAENHGFQTSRKKEYIEWIKAQFEEHSQYRIHH